MHEIALRAICEMYMYVCTIERPIIVLTRTH